ncbi:MAG TPA: TetR/AcrR family transcriptional regulator [Ramlibacter sp.]|nr:TetR/AcrR family transcriptional regulator [Ramlibacter sp.]
MTAPVFATAKHSFKEQMLAAREEAIIENVNRLLVEKGYDAMTVDEVAAGVGIAKASLYKHFTSKEELAAAAMVQVMRRAQQYLATIPQDLAPLDKLKAVVRWTLEVQLAGKMPSLPSQNSTLRAALLATSAYRDALTQISELLGGWIVAAQAQGTLNPRLPPQAVLYTLYARGCDPVVEFLKACSQHSDAEIVELVLGTCFDGLNAR